MFLTRIDVNPARRKSRELLANPEAMHARVMRACAGTVGLSEGRVLWRIDQDQDRVALYVSSPGNPMIEELNNEIGWADTSFAKTANYEPFLNKLRIGQTYAFRLTANPTHLVTENGRKHRYGHVTESQQRQWFLDRSELNGFNVRSAVPDSGPDPIPEVVVHDRTIRTFRRQGRPVTIAMASFSGWLDVTDVELLRSALTAGIGRAKAYGCGLLTLAR